MADRVEERLRTLGIVLPAAATPVANYVPYVVSGNLIFISGQLPMRDGALQFTGLVGKATSVADGYEAAKLCAINLIAQVKSACDDNLGRVKTSGKINRFRCIG